ncbi:hypothetical protein D3C74_75460 [compost metagenome]
MLIKMITCKVRDDSKKRFHYAQTKWAELNNVSGFIAQVGGWNIVNTNEAVIIAVWETLEKYNLFMSKIHDQIIARSEQTSSYENIEVSLWKTDKIIKHNEIVNCKYLALENTKNNSLISDNYVFISHMKNDRERKLLLFQNDLENIKGSKEVLITIDKEWTVSSRCQ